MNKHLESYFATLAAMTYCDKVSAPAHIKTLMRDVILTHAEYDALKGWKIEVNDCESSKKLLNFVVDTMLQDSIKSYAITYHAARKSRILRVSFSGSF